MTTAKPLNGIHRRSFDCQRTASGRPYQPQREPAWHGLYLAPRGVHRRPGIGPPRALPPLIDPPPSATHDGARTNNGVLACSRARVPKRAIAVVSPPRRLEPVLVGVARRGLVADGGGGGGRVGRGGAARPPVHSQRASSLWWRVAHAKPPSGERPSLSRSAREAAARQAPRHQLAYSKDANHFGDQVPAGPLLPSRRPTATGQRGGGI